MLNTNDKFVVKKAWGNNSQTILYIVQGRHGQE